MSKQQPASAGQSTATAKEQLEVLRRKIDQVDEGLVKLLAERQRIIDDVMHIKQLHEMPTSHPAREENLISARRAQASAAGLDPDYVEDLFRTMLRHSRVGQLDTLSRRSARPGGKILIVGGRGGMGRFFGKWFVQSDYEVRVLEAQDWDRVDQLTAGINLCLLAVPIDVTPKVAAQIAPHLPKGCVLADVTSLKKQPLDAMLQSYAGPVVGLHPLFGPATTTMDRQTVVVSPGRDEDACQWVLDQLTIWGVVLVETPAAEHDEIMGIVQALRHFATFAFGQFLHSRKVPIFRTLELSSPIYRLELGMVGRLFAQDPSMYAEIVFASPERQALLKEYISSMAQNMELIEKGDKAEFVARFRKVAEWFGPFSEQAMRESTFLVDKLVQRF